MRAEVSQRRIMSARSATGSRRRTIFATTASAPYQSRRGAEFPVLDGQRCYYCGAPAQAAGPNMEWERRARGERFHFTCFRCGLVYSEVISAALADVPEGLSRDAQIAALADLTSDADKLVRERVRDEQA